MTAMERLKSMKEQLMAQIQTQLNNIHQADAQELGAAVDMLKDISETAYYCSVVKAMEASEEEKELMRKSGGADHYYYTERYMPIPYQRTMDRDMDRSYGRMYYDGGNHRENPRDTGGNDMPRYMGGNRYYEGMEMTRDNREGRSPTRRKSYMEAKESHQPKEKQMHELEQYMQELSSDITEMIHGASPEERQVLQKKLAALANKIDQVQ